MELPKTLQNIPPVVIVAIIVVIVVIGMVVKQFVGKPKSSDKNDDDSPGLGLGVGLSNDQDDSPGLGLGVGLSNDQDDNQQGVQDSTTETHDLISSNLSATETQSSSATDENACEFGLVSEPIQLGQRYDVCGKKHGRYGIASEKQTSRCASGFRCYYHSPDNDFGHCINTGTARTARRIL